MDARQQVAHERRQQEKIRYKQERAGDGNGKKGIHIIRAGDFFDAIQQHDKHDRGGNIGDQDKSDELAQNDCRTRFKPVASAAAPSTPRKLNSNLWSSFWILIISQSSPKRITV